MTMLRVVKHLDVVEDITANFFAIEIDLASDSLQLEKQEEPFCDGIVVAASASAHAGNQVMGFQEGMPVMATILTPLVGMDNDEGLGVSPP